MRNKESVMSLDQSTLLSVAPVGLLLGEGLPVVTWATLTVRAAWTAVAAALIASATSKRAA